MEFRISVCGAGLNAYTFQTPGKMPGRLRPNWLFIPAATGVKTR